MGTPARVCLGLVLLVLVALDVGGIIAATRGIWFPTGNPASPYGSLHLESGGGVVLRRHDPQGYTLRIQHLSPASALSALPIWWLVVPGVALGVFTLAVARALARRRLSSSRLEQPRFTISGGLVLIGAVSIWLWLTRTGMFWIHCGSLVLVLALLAHSRRNRLAKEIKSKGTSATVWMRLGVAGYSVAVILSLSWIVCIIVWDTLRPGR